MKQSALPLETQGSGAVDLSAETLVGLDRVAVTQFNPTTGALLKNTEKIIAEIRMARENGAQLIAFPETAITGYCSADKFLYDEYIEDNKSCLDKIAPETKGFVAIVGFVDYDTALRNDDGTLRKYNAAAVFDDGKLVAIVRKTNLPNYSKFDDKRYFSSGDNTEPVTVRIGGKEVKLGVVICEDFWDEHYGKKVIGDLNAAGAEIFVAINASPGAEQKFFVRDEILRRHVAETKKPLIAVNTVGAGDIGKTIVPFDGESLVYDGDGTLLFRGEQYAEGTTLVSLNAARKYPAKPREISKEQEKFDAAVMTVRDMAQKTGFKTVLAPVSGGIDSEVGLAILVRALGSENVIAFNMPTKFNSETTKSIAEETCRKLGVRYVSIPLQELVDHVVEVFEKYNHPIQRKTHVNGCLQGRLRMVLAMMECNDTDPMLVSFANKTEAALGYSNLYGIDGAGAMAPIGDFSKMDVFKVGKYINRLFGREIIPAKLFPGAPDYLKPSAEQEEGQFDPFDYPVVSPLMEEFIEYRRGPRSVIELFKQQALDPERWEPDHEGKTVYEKYDLKSFEDSVYRYFKKFLEQPFKRLQQPPPVSVSGRALGFDWRESIINGWDGKPIL